MKVSIIVPIYNVEKYLDKCIQSLINQTYKNIQILLINDGSTDNSEEICKRYLNSDKRIEYFCKTNGGLSDARNVGIKKAKGKFLVFVDSDDFVDENMIQILVDDVKKYDADIAICNRYYYYENDTKLIKNPILHSKLILNSEKAIEEMNSYNNFDMSATCKIFKKYLFEKIEFPIGKICEDFYIMYKLFDLSKVIVYDPTPLYYYFQRKGSISKSPNLKIDFITAATEQMLYLEKNHSKLKNCGRSAYCLSYLTVYNAFYLSGGDSKIIDLKKFRKEVKKNYKYVLRNNKLNYKRKIQPLIFLLNIKLYNYILYSLKRKDYNNGIK